MNARAIVVTGGVAAVLFIGGAFAQNPQPSHAPGLVESMLTAQSHHAKLWFAGNAQNWELAEYQIDELEEGLEDTAKNVPDYKGVPVGKMIELAHHGPDRGSRERRQEPGSRPVHGGLRQAHRSVQQLP